MFKYTLECTGKMPAVNLKRPQMVVNAKANKDDSGQPKQNMGPKAVLFGDSKKSDHLFNFDGDLSDDPKSAISHNEKINNDSSDLDD